MAKTTYEAVRPLVDGRAVEVLERDERGFLVGSWIGYWNGNRGVVNLYPNVKNRFVNWPKGKIPQGKRVISDRLVLIQDRKSEIRNGSSSSTDKTDITAKGESWRDKKLPMKEQERIDV